MAFAHGELCKTIAMVAQLSAPYLTEGATKIDEGQLVGKRVGETYKFAFDKADIGVSKDGMNTSFSSSGAVTSDTCELKIWNASAKIANGALDKKLSAGDWEQFAKQTGVDVVNAMVKEVALADLGKAGEAIVVADVNKLTAKSLVMNKYGATVRAYGSWNGIGAILGSSKLNAPMLSEDKYANGKAWSFGNYATMRGIDLPSLNLSASTSVTAVTVKADGSVDSITGTLTAGETVKLGDALFVYFPTTDATDGIVIGAKPSSETEYSVVSVSADTTYEPIIVRADGAQGAVDASSLIEASDATEGYEGVGVAHTEIKQANRGVDHYYDVAGAYGVARKEAVKVMLLKC